MELAVFEAANNTGSRRLQETQSFRWALFDSGAPPVSAALTLEKPKVSVRRPNDHQLFVLFGWRCLCRLQSTGNILSLFCLLLVIGPPANPAALNLASAAIAIVVSYAQITEEFCDR